MDAQDDNGNDKTPGLGGCSDRIDLAAGGFVGLHCFWKAKIELNFK